MKKYLITLFILPNIAFAQNIIFKCNSDSDISYLTFPKNKPTIEGCVKTDLGDVEPISIVSGRTQSHDSKKSNVSFGATKPVLSEEQKKRDIDRNAILSQELELEKKELANTNTLLNELTTSKSKDSEQLSKLNALKNTHQQNITSLHKALGLEVPNINYCTFSTSS